MPSSKGKPTDPKLREQAKNEVKQMEKGGGKGQWSAWKAAEMAKVYEKKGGGYEDTGSNPNAAKKGDPKPKASAVKSGERKAKDAPVGETKKSTASKAKKAAPAAKKTQSSTQKETKGKKTSSASAAATKKTKAAAAPKKKAVGSRATPKRAAAAAA